MLRLSGISSVMLIAAALYLTLSTPGSALKCYVCNSLHNDSCDHLVDDHYLMDCATVNTNPEKNHTNCRKEVFSAYSAAFDMHTERTVRSCGYEKHPRLSCFFASNIDLKGTTCECVEDGCNGSNILHITSVPIVLIVLGGILFSYVIT